MSSGSRLVSSAAVRRSLIQSYSRHSPLSVSSTLRHRTRSGRQLPTYTEALAILIPNRGYATETSTHGGNDSGPPPGFNINEAKKPLRKEEAKTSAPTIADLKKADEQLSTPQGEPTVADKSVGADKATLSELAASKATSKGKAEDKNAVAKKEDDKKLTLGQKIKKEIQHYWDGTKLLATEVRISTKLALKMAAGYELSRRENRQLKRTVQDLGRLVPFSVFVIVPFAELLLPIALKIFPNLLPSTYEGQKSKEVKAARLRSTRKQTSAFLRETLRESGLPISAATAKKEDFTEFFRKVRSSGEQPTKADVIKICKSFRDDLTLDNLSRPQLVGMCKYMNLNTFGTDTMLRYQIRHRMRQIKRDDKAISFEGVDSLSIPELQMACASRGLRTHGMQPGKLREDLQMWLDLRLKYNIPSTLLVLSNAYMYTSGQDAEIDSQIDALRAVLSSIPEELFHEIELEVHNAEGVATNKQRLEVLKEQQELIDEENEQAQTDSESTKENGKEEIKVKDDKNIDETSKPKPDAEVKAKDAPQTAEEKEAVEAEQDTSEQGKNEEVRKEADVKKD